MRVVQKNWTITNLSKPKGKKVLTNASGKNVLPQILQGNNSPTWTLPFSKTEKIFVNKFYVQIVKLPSFNVLS